MIQCSRSPRGHQKVIKRPSWFISGSNVRGERRDHEQRDHVVRRHRGACQQECRIREPNLRDGGHGVCHQRSSRGTQLPGKEAIKRRSRGDPDRDRDPDRDPDPDRDQEAIERRSRVPSRAPCSPCAPGEQAPRQPSRRPAARARGARVSQDPRARRSPDEGRHPIPIREAIKGHQAGSSSPLTSSLLSIEVSITSSCSEWTRLGMPECVGKSCRSQRAASACPLAAAIGV